MENSSLVSKNPINAVMIRLFVKSDMINGVNLITAIWTTKVLTVKTDVNIDAVTLPNPPRLLNAYIFYQNFIEKKNGK
jgi:hypothetical protein